MEDGEALSVNEDLASFADFTVAGNAGTTAASLTLEEASARIDPQALQVLEEKFNGSLAEVRTTDDKDQFL